MSRSFGGEPGESDARREELAEVWQRHAGELFRRCLVWMGGHRGDAEEAFCRVWSKLARRPRQAEISDRRAWLLKLAYNECVDLHRIKKRRGEESLDEHAVIARFEELQLGVALSSADPEDRFLEAELVRYMGRCILDLSPKLRDTLQLSIRQLSYREIAEELAINEATVRKRIQLARQILRGRLEEYRLGRGRSRPRRRRSTTEPLAPDAAEEDECLAWAAGADQFTAWPRRTS